MRMWPISTRVNKPENEDFSIGEPIELVTELRNNFRNYHGPHRRPFRQSCKRSASRSTSSGSHGFGMNIAPSGRLFGSARPEVTMTRIFG
jgi:hypothetical protein